MLITCDESTEFKINVVGSISIPFEDFFIFEDFFNIQRINSKVFGEIKWDKIGEEGKYFDFYFEVTKKLFSYPKVRFHSNSYTSNKYTAVYALIRSVSWKLSNMNNNDDIGVLVDYSGEKGRQETNLSREILAKDRRIKHKVTFCNQIDSKIFNILQITDLLTGCVAYKKNLNEIKATKGINRIKMEFIEKIEKEIDGNNDCTAITAGLWKYDCNKKLQHYDFGPYVSPSDSPPF